MVEIPYKEYQALQDARELAESTIKAVREPLIVLDGDLRILFAGTAFYKTFHVESQETEKRFIYDLGNKQWDIPALRKLLEGLLPTNESFDDYRVEHDFPAIGKRTMLLNARRIPRPPAKARLILLAIEDVTEREKTEKELVRKIKELEEFHDLAVGRELKMAWMEEEIERLKKQ
jgi:PAS domain-containing protein